MKVGIISFQGDVSEHSAVLKSLGCDAMEIRVLAECEGLTHLIIPGGESTVIAYFLKKTGIDKWIIRETRKGTLSVFGTCAGAILLAHEAVGKSAPQTLDLIDMTIERNAYGSQSDSFEELVQVSGIDQYIQAAFIRAPRITRTGATVEVMARFNNEPILVRCGKILASTFHPEVRGDATLHTFFLSL
jgi:5'-phosphate synthase pdxT subunit